MDMGLKSGSCADLPEQIVASGKAGRSSVPNCVSPSGDGTSIVKEDTNNKSPVAEQGTYHQQRSHHGYDGQGHPELDELSYFFAGDGVELPFSGVQSDDPSMFFYMPRYSHDNSATLWGLDEQFVGQQSFFPSFEYLHPSLSSESTDSTSHVADSQDAVPALASPKLNASTPSGESTLVSDSQKGVALGDPKSNASDPSPPTLLKPKGCKGMEGVVVTLFSDSQNEAALGDPKSNASSPNPPTLQKPKGHKGMDRVIGTLVSDSQNGEAPLGAPKSNASGPSPLTLLKPKGCKGMVSDSQNGGAALGDTKSNASGPSPPTLQKPKGHKGMDGVVSILVSDSQHGQAAPGVPKSNASGPSPLTLLKPKDHKRMEGVVGIKCSAQSSKSMSHASNAYSSCLNSSYNTQLTKLANKVSQQASNFHPSGPSNGYYTTQKFSSVSNQRNTGSSQQSGFKNIRPNSLSRVSDGKYQMIENFEKRGEQNSSKEFSRGPRASRWRDALGSSSRNAPSVSSIRKDQYNLKDFETKYEHALFFVIKSFSEDDIHKSIKYNVWASTPAGNKKLDAAFHDAESKSREKGSSCPLFLFFSVNGSGQFVGLAEMIGQVDFKKNMDFWQYDNWWDGFFPVKWHMIKDIPNKQFHHIILENNENKPVTFSRDTQEMGFPQGSEMLRIFKSYPEESSLLDDLDFYEEREKSKISNHVSAQPRPNRNNSQHSVGRKVDVPARATLQRHTERETRVEEASTIARVTKDVNQPLTTLAALAKNFSDGVSTRTTLQRHADRETKVEGTSTRTRTTNVANQPFTTLASLAKNFSINDSPQKKM